MTSPLLLPKESRILVIALRRLGDVLLTTPLLRSMRRAWPSAKIEVLVFADTAGILDGNPDIDGIVTMPPQSTAAQSFALARRLWQRYALAVSTQAGDRPTTFAKIAGKIAVALVEDGAKGRFKRRWLDRTVEYRRDVHRVEEILRFADALGIPRMSQVVCPHSASAAQFLIGGGYAVLHPAPFYRYKQWTRDGWRKLAATFADRGLSVVITGGTAAKETEELDAIWDKNAPLVRRLDGRLNWGQLATVLAGAKLYVGPDTSVTHLAAASGCPTVALFGPTDPRLWAPWPAAGLAEPWQATGDIQRRGNVWLVQNALPCTPCQLEGCERNTGSYSTCLDELSPLDVIAAVEAALASIDETVEPPRL
jgi:heptosyltransferase-3